MNQYGNAYGHQAQMGFDWGGLGSVIGEVVPIFTGGDDPPRQEIVYMQPPPPAPAPGGMGMGEIGPWLLWGGGGAAIGYFMGRGRKKTTYALMGAAAGVGAKWVMGGFPG